MNDVAATVLKAPPARPFFVRAGQGQRFAIFHQPAPGSDPRGAIVYVHPFAEEMNKSRRMAALQARAFAASGYGVLQLDLYGCGDSDGDFADARWHIWQEDIALACAWLAPRLGAPLSLWGMRLGALLALEMSQRAELNARQLILWHPVLSGRTCMDQFLRLRLAGDMLCAADSAANGASNAGLAPRQQLAAGDTVEVAGYALAPQLASAIDALDAGAITPAIPLHWFDQCVAPPADGTEADAAFGLTPAVRRVAGQWRSRGASLTLHSLRGLPFWAGGEVLECPALLHATRACCA